MHICKNNINRAKKENGSELFTKYYFDNYELIEQNGTAIEKIPAGADMPSVPEYLS